MGEKVEILSDPSKQMLNLAVYDAVRKHRSVRRAIRRGHVTSWGETIPKRPFNNKKRTEGRELQKEKERIYGQLQHRKKVLAEKPSEGGAQ